MIIRHYILGLGALAGAAALSPAWAHEFATTHATGVLDAFLHPFSGLDHLAAMLALGLWAAGCAGPTRVALPLAFIVALAAGALAGAGGPGLPPVESGIALSLVVLGLAVALRAAVPLSVALILAGVCALCHGYAHGSELFAGRADAAVLAAFVAATAVLHAIGFAVGYVARNGGAAYAAVRTVGAMTAAAGTWLLAAA